MAVSAVKDFANSTTAKLALAAVVAFSGAAAEAQNIPTKGCFNDAVLQPVLDKDGQKRIFIGKRVDGSGLLPGNLFYMNDNGYGLNVERDPKTRDLCVRLAYKGIKLNYPDNSVVPNWAREIKSVNGVDIAKAYQKGERFIFMATAFDRDTNGNEIVGKKITIMAGASKLASVWVINSQNEPDGLGDFVSFGIYDADFNQFIARGHGIAMADRPQMVAANNKPAVTP